MLTPEPSRSMRFFLGGKSQWCFDDETKRRVQGFVCSEAAASQCLTDTGRVGVVFRIRE